MAKSALVAVLFDVVEDREGVEREGEERDRADTPTKTGGICDIVCVVGSIAF